MKRIIVILLMSVFTVFNSFAQGFFESDGVRYSVRSSSQKTVAVTHLINDYYKGDVIIPSKVSYNGINYSVTAVEREAFYNCNELTSITISDGITVIEDFAFAECIGLNSLSTPGSVKEIRDFAFGHCENLKSVDFANGIEKIGDYAFSYCKSLTSVIIPPSISYISYDSFLRCSGLTDISVDPGNTYYDSRNNCNAIIETNSNMLILGCKNSAIPLDVVAIGPNAFDGCTGLTSITIPNSVVDLAEWAFAGCSGLKAITIPDAVEHIGTYAFYGCIGLSSVTVPAGVKRIGEQAFTNLKTITVDAGNTVYDSRDGCNAIIETATNTLIVGCDGSKIPAEVTKICEGAFIGHTDMTEIYIPANVKEIGYYAFGGCDNISSISVSKDNTVYDSRDNCNAIIETGTNILIKGCDNSTIPSGVVQIMDDAFSGCQRLTSITVPSSVESIGYDAFLGCTNLSSITLSEGLKTISADAFAICKGLSSIIIPNSVREIDPYAFAECTNLSSITFPTEMDYVGSNAFNNTAWYENQPDGVVYAGNVLYDYKGTMAENTEIVIKQGTTSISDMAFDSCTNLVSIVMPNSVKDLGWSVFQGCSNLSSIILPDNVTNIGGYAFAGCSSLTSINIPEGVSRIEENTFSGCTGLESIIIPEGVTSIGRNAFEGCSGLKSISIPSSLNGYWTYSGSFSDCKNVDTVYWNVQSFSCHDLDYLLSDRLPIKCIVFGDSVQKFTEETYYDYSQKIGNDFSALTSITMCSRNPGQLQIDANYFNTIDYDNCILYVPYGGRYAYSTTEPWSKFKNIRRSDKIVHGVCIDDMYYEITSFEDKTASLIRGKNENLVDVPASVTIDGVNYAVTGIDTESFSDCDELASIRIPGSVKFIAERAFENCIALNRVVIEGSPEIAVNAFIDSPNIESVYSIGLVPGKINYLNPFIGGEFDNIKATSGRKFAEYNDELSRTVTMVTRRECEILMNGIPAGRYRVSVGIVPSPENKPNRFHPAIFGITDTTDIVLFDSVTIATKPRPRRTPYTVGNQDKFTYDTITTYIEELDTYFNDYVFVSSEYDSVLILDTFVVPDNLKGLRLTISEKNADTIIIDRVFFEPLDDISEDKYAGPFTESVFNNATLYVLEEAVDAYRNADGWKLFKNIGVETAVKPLRKATRKNTGNEPIYDVAGRRQNVQSIDDLAPGLYIIGGKSYLKH